jgi:hypothetical protein
MWLLHARGPHARVVLLALAAALFLLTPIARPQDRALAPAGQGKLVVTTIPEGATVLLARIIHDIRG